MLGRGFPVALQTKITVPLDTPTTDIGGPIITGATAINKKIN